MILDERRRPGVTWSWPSRARRDSGPRPAAPEVPTVEVAVEIAEQWILARLAQRDALLARLAERAGSRKEKDQTHPPPKPKPASVRSDHDALDGPIAMARSR